jgi:hypothetical protein
MRIWRYSLIGVMLSLAYTVPALAQLSSTGTIRGVVTDPNGAALQDATIIAISPDAPLPRRATSTADGSYVLTDLLPGTYTITVERAGFAKFTQPQVRVGAGLTLGLDIPMQVGGVSENVVVKREAPMLEVTRPGQVLNISGDFQRELPLSQRRNWDQFLELLPGATMQSTRFASPTVPYRGAAGGSQVFQIDGMDATGRRNDGSDTKFNVDAILDIQVRTATADASTPLGQGVVANIVTRSGTNVLRGFGSVLWRDKKWNSNNLPGGTAPGLAIFQPDAALGGPVLRDRTFFFGSYRHIKTEGALSRTATQVANLKAIAPGFTPFWDVTEASIALGKVTHMIATSELTASVGYDRIPNSSSTNQMAVPLQNVINGGPWLALKLSSPLTPKTVTQVSVLYNDKRSGTRVIHDNDLPQRNIYEAANRSGAVLSPSNLLALLDGVLNVTENIATTVVATADVTRLIDNVAGSHEAKIGVYYRKVEEETQQDYSNGGFGQIDEVLRDRTNPAGGSIPFRTVTFSPASLSTARSDSHDLGFYIQDSWRPTSRLSIAGGVRVDAIKRRDLIFNQQVEDAIVVGPRIGATLSLDRNNRHIVHVAAGKLHSALAETAGFSLGATSVTRVDSYDVDLNGSFETVVTTPGATALSANRFIDPEFTQPHVNEVTAGYRVQLPAQISLDLGWFHRDFRNGVVSVEVNGIYTNGVFAGYQDLTQSAINKQTNNIWNWRVYNDLSIRVSKQSARFQALASYTRQWRHVDGTWVPNDPASFIQPDAFPNNKDVGSPTLTAPTSYPQLNGYWLDHIVRMAGTAQLPMGIALSGSWNIQSGPWSGPIYTVLPAADSRFGPSLVTLSNGRQTTNPLATTTRFAYATRGEGQLEQDTLHLANVRVAKDFRFRSLNASVAVDVFNIINADADQAFMSTTLTDSTFGVGTSRQMPRGGQLTFGVRF